MNRRLQLLFAFLLTLLIAACGGGQSDDATPGAPALATSAPGGTTDGAAPPVTDGAVSEEVRGEVESRLRALGLTPPLGAMLIEVGDLDDTDVEVTYLVGTMSPIEAIDFYLTSLPAGGYEITSQDDDEIAFRNDSLTGEIEVKSDDRGTLLQIDVEQR